LFVCLGMMKAVHDLGVSAGFNEITGNTAAATGPLLGNSADLMNGFLANMPDMSGVASTAAANTQPNPMSLFAAAGVLNCNGCDGCGGKGEFKEMASLMPNITRHNCTHVTVQEKTGKSREMKTEGNLYEKIKLSEQLHGLLAQIKNLKQQQSLRHQHAPKPQVEILKTESDNSQTRHRVPLKLENRTDFISEIDADNSQTRHRVSLKMENRTDETGSNSKIDVDNSQTRQNVPMKMRNKTDDLESSSKIGLDNNLQTGTSPNIKTNHGNDRASLNKNQTLKDSVYSTNKSVTMLTKVRRKRLKLNVSSHQNQQLDSSITNITDSRKTRIIVEDNPQTRHRLPKKHLMPSKATRKNKTRRVSKITKRKNVISKWKKSQRKTKHSSYNTRQKRNAEENRKDL